ncbi:MAG: hypothetical protein K0S32_3506 [Bacteroidetes bacterium]|jgi:hypothetical protein|nr:hypothetical protein [Bacteroidota bacterium]
MEKIKLRNVKPETMIATIAMLALAAVIFYWGMFTKINLKVSGAKLGPSASSGLAITISVFAFIGALNYLIRFISINKFGDFSIIMDNEKITYPYEVTFKGYKKAEIYKHAIDYVELVEIKAGSFTIDLKNAESSTVGIINTTMIPYKVMTPEQAAEKIRQWIQS